MRLAGILAAAALAATTAPADQYFGQFKMSALRIRYETMQVKAHYESRKLLPEDAEHLAELTQRAFEDWARRYPHDPWLPSSADLLAKLYEELPGTSARDRALGLLHFIASSFARTSYGAQSRAALRNGLPVRPDPAWAAAIRRARAPTPTPAPKAPPSAPGSPAPSPTRSGAASATPGSTASPTPGSTPSAKPSERPRN